MSQADLPSLSVYKTPAGQARFENAYRTVLEQWPVPYEELAVPTRFGRTHVVACGPQDAPPLVLLHAYFATATVWFPNAAALSQHYRMYAVDCIGEPNPSVPACPITSRQGFADWLADLFDGLHIQRARLVGNSNGGFITMNMAIMAPQRVEKFALIGPAATFVQIWPFYFNFFLPVMFGWQKLIRRGLRWFAQGLPSDPAWLELFQLSMEVGAPRNQVFPSVFSDAELASVRVPGLLLVGDHEVIYARRQAPIERALRLVPGLQAELVPSAHHISAMANPDWVSARLLKFFNE